MPSAALPSSICWWNTLTPAISATARSAMTGAMAAAAVRPVVYGQRDSPDGRSGETLDDTRADRSSSSYHHGYHHHDTAEEGHPALLDERADAAAKKRTAGRPRLHAALRAGA